MNALLAKVLSAHGGQSNWLRINRIEAELTFGGPFWTAKGQPDLLTSESIEADAREQRIAMTPFAGDDDRACFLDNGDRPERITIQTGEGVVLESREDPRSSFAGFGADTRWDPLQVAYFASYACWTYLTEPFLLTYPGVEVEEIEPWREDGRTWQRLRATFPESIDTHSTVQTYYFDDGGLLRRLDYDPIATGGSSAADYVDDHDVFNGFMVPTRRRVCLRQPDGTADKSRPLITLDLTELALS